MHEPILIPHNFIPVVDVRLLGHISSAVGKRSQSIAKLIKRYNDFHSTLSTLLQSQDKLDTLPPLLTTKQLFDPTQAHVLWIDTAFRALPETSSRAPWLGDPMRKAIQATQVVDRSAEELKRLDHEVSAVRGWVGWHLLSTKLFKADCQGTFAIITSDQPCR